MIKHYNAFISYKHAQVDSKVAAAVQRSLERYRIPGKIRKKTGVNKIERVFRDKDELPITSNLGDDISYALEHADYLIVICSPRTKESIWVSREIDYFLQTHDKSKVLTVLAEGEPQDVIPEILLTDEEVFEDENGNQVKRTIPMEPLSADYRMSMKAATREELPRLAATLVGCSYDELMNRQRQYRMRRTTAIFAGILSVALGFGAYMFYSNMRLDESNRRLDESNRQLEERNVQLDESYQEVLRNRSRYLANESGKLLDDEQRMDALQLALAALPSEKNPNIPVTPEAIRALTDASMAYVTLNDANISAVWNYQMNNNISEMVVSRDGKKLAARDNKGNVVVWSTETHQELLRLDRVEDLSFISFMESDKILISTSKVAYAYDLETGKECWNFPTEDYERIGAKGLMIDEEHVLIVLDSVQFYNVNINTGKVEAQYEAGGLDPEGQFRTHGSKYKLSPDKSKIAYDAYLTGEDAEIVGIFDFETLETKYYECENADLIFFGWADNDHLAISSVEDTTDSSMSMYDYSLIKTDHCLLYCLDVRDLNVIWETDFTSNEVAVKSDFLYLPAIHAVGYYEGNMCRIYEVETGEMLYEHNVSDVIIEANDNDGDGSPIYITKSGCSLNPAPNYGGDALYSRPYFTDDLAEAVVNRGVYVKKSLSSQIIYYGVYVCDEEWTSFEEVTDLDTILDGDYVMDDHYLMTMTKEGNDYDTAILTVFDLEQSKMVLQEEMQGEDDRSYQYTPLGVADGKAFLFRDVYSDELLVEVDLETGAQKERHRDAAASRLSMLKDGDAVREAYAIALEEATTYGNDEEDDTPEFLTKDPDRILMGYLECTLGEKDVVLAAYNDGGLSKFDAETGEFLESTGISRYINGTYECSFVLDEDRDRVYVQFGKLCDVVELSSFVEVACVQHCLGVDVPRNRFITTSSGDGRENHVGYFKQYTLEELIQKGEAILQGVEMSPEAKSAYGIE